MSGEKADGGSAFPSHGSMGEVEHRGMSLRDWFAGQALAGLLANRKTICSSGDFQALSEVSAKVCFVLADAMLEARKK